MEFGSLLDHIYTKTQNFSDNLAVHAFMCESSQRSRFDPREKPFQ